MLLLLGALSLHAAGGAPLEAAQGLLRTQKVRRNATHTVATEGGWPRALPHAEWRAFVEKHHAVAMPDAYWDFVPAYLGSVAPALEFETFCGNASATVAVADGAVQVAFRRTGRPEALACDDFFLLTTTQSVHVETLASLGSKTLSWRNLTQIELDDIAANGVRLFRFDKDIFGTVAAALETALLFAEPLVAKPVSAQAEARNVDFLRDYAPGELGEHHYEPRTAGRIDVDEADVSDGDLFIVMRLDGLDPMINWGTGGNSGHNVMALRFDGELHMVESQVASSYWPKDFVQRNSFKDWMDYAEAADYNVVHLKLSDDSKERFNASKARETFENDFEGLLYGYPTLLWGWFDNLDNFPPPLDINLISTLFSVVDPLIAHFADMPSLWNGAISHRLGLDPANTKTTAELLAVAQGRNLSMADLIAIPEQDSWTYPLDNASCGRAAGCDGPAMVCNVFVCRMWKAGGLFDADFNCGEQTPLDTYSMSVFDLSPELSDACVNGTPYDDEFCQVLGDRVVRLPHVGTVAPFANMSQDCPSKAPNYTARFDPAVAASC
mmetsp:Transcript_7462/g.22084  ORF Transcript_7462/g.22084 Transcript_7462/m.22084 type:complete len:553 (-) Transcript_7462:18-1676(-)